MYYKKTEEWFTVHKRIRAGQSQAQCCFGIKDLNIVGFDVWGASWGQILADIMGSMYFLIIHLLNTSCMPGVAPNVQEMGQSVAKRSVNHFVDPSVCCSHQSRLLTFSVSDDTALADACPQVFRFLPTLSCSCQLWRFMWCSLAIDCCLYCCHLEQTMDGCFLRWTLPLLLEWMLFVLFCFCECKLFSCKCSSVSSILWVPDTTGCIYSVHCNPI